MSSHDPAGAARNVACPSCGWTLVPEPLSLVSVCHNPRCRIQPAPPASEAGQKRFHSGDQVFEHFVPGFKRPDQELSPYAEAGHREDSDEGLVKALVPLLTAFRALQEENQRTGRKLADAEHLLSYGGIIEFMVRNPNVDSWAKEHEARTLKAESEVRALQEEKDEAKRELAEALRTLKGEGTDDLVGLSLVWIGGDAMLDRFTAWYKPEQWMGMHRAASAFLQQELDALKASVRALQERAERAEKESDRLREQWRISETGRSEALQSSEIRGSPPPSHPVGWG